MWTKITNEEQLNKLVVDAIIMKYPLDGAPVDNAEGANKINSGKRRIIKNSGGQIDFIIDDMPNVIDIGTGIKKVSISPIHKKYTSFIEEGIWWINI